jgi:hypothetical protein
VKSKPRKSEMVAVLHRTQFFSFQFTRNTFSGDAPGRAGCVVSKSFFCFFLVPWRDVFFLAKPQKREVYFPLIYI